MPPCNSALIATPAAALLRPGWPGTSLQREATRAARNGQWRCALKKQRRLTLGNCH